MSIQSVWRRVLCAAGWPQVVLTIVDDQRVQAWADGDGIFVTRGLIEQSTEREVGGVFGHELAHVLLRHGPDRQRALRRARASAAEEMERLDTIASLAAALVVAPVILAAERRRARRNELQADLLGDVLAAAAGFAGGLDSFLSHLPEDGGDTGAFDTHPTTPNRRRALRVRSNSD